MITSKYENQYYTYNWGIYNYLTEFGKELCLVLRHLNNY